MAGTPISSGVGLRHARFYTVDADGIINGNQSNNTGYSGVPIEGIKELPITYPDVQRITHVGDDSAFAQDFLPPTELPTATFTTGKTNQTFDALVGNTNAVNVVDQTMTGMATSQQGYEASGMIVYYRQALDTGASSPTFGARRWQTYVLMSCRIVPQGASPTQGGDDTNSYSVTMTKVNKTPWGETFTAATHKYTMATVLRMVGDYPMFFERFNGDGTITNFTLAKRPVSTLKINAWANGLTAPISSIQNTTSPYSVTFFAPPANNAKVVVAYETDEAL